MNIYLMVIFILVILLFICTIYLLAYREQVNKIMKKEGEGAYENTISFRDLKMLYNAYKSSKNLSIYERKLLKYFYIISILSIIMFIIFGYMIFGTDW